MDINAPNKICFLKSENESYFDFKKMIVSGLYKFLYMGMLSLGNIDNCKICTQSLIVSMYQNSNLNIINTELTNLESFKFITEDNSSLLLKNVSICGGQFIVMSKNSQACITNSTLRLKDKACKIQENACFKDSFSDCNIDGTSVSNYAFFYIR